MKFDVFLSHNSRDKPVVEEIAHQLETKGIKVWLDKWNLVPGDPWQEELESALDDSQTIAVFVGPHDISPWENEEMRSAIEERVQNKSRRVIPVLLPGAPDNRILKLPRFLKRLTWVDLRGGIDDQDAFHRLASGIKGISPGRIQTDARDSIDARIIKILEQHELWIKSFGKNGQLADLSNMDLRQTNLAGKNLSQAIVRGTDFRDADLSNANLKRATLVDSNFSGANLSKADFSYSELSRAKFTNANVDGANFSHAILSDAIDLSLAKNIERASLPGHLWIEVKRIADKFGRDSIAANPIWKAREYEQDPNLCFVIMPFSNDPPYQYTQDVYKDHVKPVIADRFGLTCMHAKDIFGPTEIMEDIWQYILRSRLLIADVTGRNPNVFYELGIAHTVGRRVVVITQNDDDVPFDIRQFRYLKYQPIPGKLKDFEDQLSKHIASIIGRMPEL